MEEMKLSALWFNSSDMPRRVWEKAE